MLATRLRNFPIVASRNPVDLINSAKRLFRNSISPVGPLVESDHLLRGVWSPDFSVGYIESDLQVRVSAAPSSGSYFLNFGVAGQLRAACHGEDASLSDLHGTVFNPGDSQELHPGPCVSG